MRVIEVCGSSRQGWSVDVGVLNKLRQVKSGVTYRANKGGTVWLMVLARVLPNNASH